MPSTCGHCGRRDQTISHIRSCSSAGTSSLSNAQGSQQSVTPPEPRTSRKKRAKPAEPKTRNAKRTVSGSRSYGRGSRPKLDDFRTPAPGSLTSDEARAKYPSGASKEPSSKDPPKRSSSTDRTSRGGANFSRHGMVNPPPSGKPSTRDY